MAQGLANLPGEVDIWWRILEDVVRQSAPFAGARCASLGRLDRRHRGQVDQGRLWHLALTSDGERLRLADMVRCRGAQFVIDYTAASLADGKGAEVKRFYVELHHRHLLRELLNVMHTRSGKRKLQLPSRGGIALTHHSCGAVLRTSGWVATTRPLSVAAQHPPIIRPLTCVNAVGTMGLCTALLT